MVFWIVWVIVGLFFVLAFTAMVTPMLIFKLHAAAIPVHAEAIDRFSDKFGEVVVYLPDASVRRYMSGYRIGVNESGLYFRGEWAKKSAFVQYELTAYGENDAVLDIIRVSEKFNDGKYTADIPLPAATDYVGLRITCVDDDPQPAKRRPFGAKFAIWLAVLCAYLSVACDAALWLGITFLLRLTDGFTMTYELPSSSWALILGLTPLAVTAVTVAVALVKFFLTGKEDSYAGR